MYYTYILECKDGTLYTGYTSDIIRRLEEHNSGRGAKYTRARRPCKIVASFSHDTKSEAMKHECAIKRLTRKEKLELVKESNNGHTPQRDLS